MKCPDDNTTLLITERSGIEIDYCPECRGVWLDRGELDKFIDKADLVMVRQSEQPQFSQKSEHSSQTNYHQPHHKKKRRESFLGDLFDF